jgi:hypothetical protein
MEGKERVQKSQLSMEFSTFEVPPQGDILVLGKRCPMGQQAAKRMLDSVAPDKFEFVEIEDDIIEAIFVKKHLFLRADRDALIKAIVEETKAIMGPGCMIRVECNIVVSVKREI